MEYRKVAEQIWAELVKQDAGTDIAVPILERELRKAAHAERDACTKLVKDTFWGFHKIPFKMWFFSVWTLVFQPRKFYVAYFKNVQIVLAKTLENREYP